MKQDMKEQLLTKSPLSLMFQLSIPAVIGMIVIGLYPLMDGIFAGNIIGQSAMTACGVALPLTFLTVVHQLYLEWEVHQFYLDLLEKVIEKP